MCNIGISPDSFNPRVLYIMKQKYNHESQLHYHAHDFVTMIYILSGSCTYKIDGTLYKVKKGDMIVCNPGVYHGKFISPDEEVTEFHLGFSNFYVKNVPKDILTGENGTPVHNLSGHEPELIKCCNEILLEQEKGGPGCDLMLKALAMKFIVIFLKSIHNSDKWSRRNLFNLENYDKASLVNAIISYINENYMEDISLEKISRNMYLSPVYISKVFKDETGESPINYLIKTRLDKARDLLEQGNMTIKEIAKNVGYNDAYHFSKLFKKYYGYPPSKHNAM